MIKRRTKILATLGPSTDDPEVLKGILDAGVNVVRINFSHNDEQEHLARIAQVRQYEKENDAFIGLMMDLQGPKIRIGSFKTEKIELKKGDQFILDAGLSENDGDQSKVGLAYKQLPSDLNSGNTLLLDDGKIILEVKKISGDKAKAVDALHHALVFCEKKNKIKYDYARYNTYTNSNSCCYKKVCKCGFKVNKTIGIFSCFFN